jgi:hypothetical protein
MADIRKIMTDKDKEVNGVWVEFAEGIKIKVARAGNFKYEQCRDALIEPHTAALRAGTLDKEIQDDILLKARARTILLDWNNIEEDGQEVPYSEAKAEEWFRNPELKDFYNFVVITSQSIDHYRKDLVEEGEGN